MFAPAHLSSLMARELAKDSQKDYLRRSDARSDGVAPPQSSSIKATMSDEEERKRRSKFPRILYFSCRSGHPAFRLAEMHNALLPRIIHPSHAISYSRHGRLNRKEEEEIIRARQSPRKSSQRSLVPLLRRGRCSGRGAAHVFL